MRKTIAPFEFKQCTSIVRSTGKHAGSLRELRKLISEAGDESIFHHTYQYFLKGHMLEYTNDFAEWAGENLEHRALSERLSSIDPYTLQTVKKVRAKLLQEIDDFLTDSPHEHEVPAGNEFYFNETVSMVFPVGVKTKNLAEFLVAIQHIDEASIYYHFYDSRVRLGEGVIDDFSRWVEHTLGKKELAVQIRDIDPFMHSIERIREHISRVVENHVRAEMEGVIN
jgi:hypothetical protein